MGLLSGIKREAKGLFGSGFGDKAAAAGMILNGDIAGGFQYRSAAADRRHDNRLNDEKVAMSRAERQAVYAWAKANNYSEEEAQALANDPNAASALIQQRDKPSEFATTGGSRYDPRTQTWIRAPGRDSDSNEYGLSTDPTQAQPILRRGTKAIPVSQGGEVRIVDALTGLRPDRVPLLPGQPGVDADKVGMGPPASAPRLGQPPPPATVGTVFRPGQVVNGYRFKGGDDTDENNWEPVQGGAGPRGPRTFPGFPY